MSGIQNNFYEPKEFADLSGQLQRQIVADPNDPEQVEQYWKRDWRIQAEAEKYNKNLQYTHQEPEFQYGYLQGRYLIIKLERKNWLIPAQITKLSEEKTVASATISSENFERSHEGNRTVKEYLTPFPYNFRGFVSMVGEDVDSFCEGDFVIKPGDFVEVNHFNLQNQRYYPDKSKTDIIHQDNLGLHNHRGHFNVMLTEISRVIPREQVLDYFKTLEQYSPTPRNIESIEDYYSPFKGITVDGKPQED